MKFFTKLYIFFFALIYFNLYFLRGVNFFKLELENQEKSLRDIMFYVINFMPHSFNFDRNDLQIGVNVMNNA